MFKLLRYYAVTSFVAILAAAVLLTWFYRQVAVRGIVAMAEHGNINLARVALNPVRDELLTYLDSIEGRPGAVAVQPLPNSLQADFATLMQSDPFLAKIKIYDAKGAVVFSTNRSEIGQDQSANRGVRSAQRGQLMSDLVYRDTFNRFDDVTEEDNLVQTYVPIRANLATPVRGVFELYTDVNSMMHEAERMQFAVIFGAIPILLVLYGVLLLIVQHASRTSEQQQRTIHERNETLAMMSAHMLRADESQKKQVAFDLHEGVAQTLAVLKLKAERGRSSRPMPVSQDEPMDSTIALLQDAIQEVRTIATELRPSSLDDHGLLPTLDSLARDSEQRRPDLKLESHYALREADVPVPLKGIVYRIVDSVLADLAQQRRSSRIDLTLGLEKGAVALMLETTPLASLPGSERYAGPGTTRSLLKFLQMEELTTLSGGRFTSSSRAEGHVVLRAVWER